MIPEEVMRELRYIEVYTAKKIRNLRVGPTPAALRGPGSTSTSTSRTARATTCGASTGT